MREDTNPDIIILVEDAMARSFLYSLIQKYILLQNQENYLDIRILEISGYQNVIHFFIEANNYIFYDNVYVAAYMDKDVQTDVISYPQYCSHQLIQSYNENSSYLRFLPYTPEVLLIKVFATEKHALLQELSTVYNNQQLNYQMPRDFDFTAYDAPFPEFDNQNAYNAYIGHRGEFRSNCKKDAEDIAKSIASQVNQSIDEIYRFVFKFAVDMVVATEINIREFLAPTMKRLRRTGNQ